MQANKSYFNISPKFIYKFQSPSIFTFLPKTKLHALIVLYQTYLFHLSLLSQKTSHNIIISLKKIIIRLFQIHVHFSFKVRFKLIKSIQIQVNNVPVTILVKTTSNTPQNEHLGCPETTPKARDVQNNTCCSTHLA